MEGTASVDPKAVVIRAGSPYTRRCGGERFRDDEHGITLYEMTSKTEVTTIMASIPDSEYRTAMDAAMDGIAILGEEGEYIDANDAHAAIYGYEDTEAFVGEHWTMCYTEADVARFEEDVLPTLAEEGGWHGEATGKRRGGITFPQEVRLTALENGGVVCAVRDVSKRKQVEREIEPTTNFLSTLLENIPAGVLAEDSDRNVKFANQEFCDLFDIPAPPEALVGNDCAAAAEAVKELSVPRKAG
jgi:PAS domain S-box-containing protein